MKLTVKVPVNAGKEPIWAVITDIEGAGNRISGIDELEILDPGGPDLVGLKWTETRTMFGKSSSETMWITEAVPNEHYKVRAESNGMIYQTVMSIVEEDGQNFLSWEFGGEAQTLGARVMGFLTMPFFKGTLRKAMLKDLEDIKKAVESAEN